MKKIYFACSIAGGRDHAHVYEDIVKYIKDSGGHVLSEIFADSNLKAHVGPTPQLSENDIWERDVAWVEEADAIIAEVTQPSLGVGYELGKAEILDKPVLALFFEGSSRRLTPMIVGNPHYQIFRYKDIFEAKEAISKFIDSL